jgi:hypothetical protein
MTILAAAPISILYLPDWLSPVSAAGAAGCLQRQNGG